MDWLLAPMFIVVTVISLLTGLGINLAWRNEFYIDKGLCEQYLERDKNCIQVWTYEGNVDKSYFKWQEEKLNNVKE